MLTAWQQSWLSELIYRRLGELTDSDRVLVMDRGHVLENDKPLTLMQREGSSFRALCMAQGEEEFSRLLVLAKKNQ